MVLNSAVLMSRDRQLAFLAANQLDGVFAITNDLVQSVRRRLQKCFFARSMTWAVRRLAQRMRARRLF
jgi:hypothetical protein